MKGISASQVISKRVVNMRDVHLERDVSRGMRSAFQPFLLALSWKLDVTRGRATVRYSCAKVGSGFLLQCLSSVKHPPPQNLIVSLL